MDFVELYKINFPQLTQEEAQRLHNQFRKYGVHSKWIFSTPNIDDAIIAQGDVFSGLYASFYDLDEEASEDILMKYGPCEAIAITNTCDNELDRDTYSVFVPLFEAEAYFVKIDDVNLQKNITDNAITSILYLPASGTMPAYIADFSICSSVTKPWLKIKKEKGQLVKKASLTSNGYYFLLAKLTLHFMRPESLDLTRQKSAE